jgi:hypothetical protein
VAIDPNAILKAHRAIQKAPLAARSDPLPLRVTNGRFIEDLDGWSEADLQQLVAVGIDGVGQAWPPQRLLDEGEDEGFYQPEVWDVLDADGRLAYRVFVYGTDNGSVARGDTIEIVAGMSQGGVEISRKKGPGCTDALIEEIARAIDRIPKGETLKGACIRFFADV